MAVNSFEVFRDTGGDVGLRETDSGKELYWDSDRGGWYAQDEFGEFQIAGDQNRGSSDVQAIDYAVAEQDGNTTLLVKTDDELRLFQELSDIEDNGLEAVFSQNGDYVVSSGLIISPSFGTSIYVYNTDDYSVETTLSPYQVNFEFVISMRFNSNNKLVISTSEGYTYIYDSSFNKVINTFNDSSGYSVSDVNLNDNRFVVADQNGDIFEYGINESTGSYELVQSLSPGGQYTAVAWDESTDNLAVVDAANDEVKIYDSSLNNTDNISVSSLDESSDDGSVDWRYDGFLAVGSSNSEVVEIYDPDFNLDQTLQRNISLDSSAISFDSDGELSVASNNGVYIYDTNFNVRKSFNESSEVDTSSWNPTSTKELVTTSSGTTRIYSIKRNQLNLSDSTLPDGFDLSVANDGSGIIEINEDGTSIFSDVGNAPKVIDNGATVDISKIDNDRYLVEGDIYKEENEGEFKKEI